MQKVGIKPQIGTITDDWLRTSAEIHVYIARARRKGYRMLISVYILCYCILFKVYRNLQKLYNNENPKSHKITLYSVNVYMSVIIYFRVSVFCPPLVLIAFASFNKFDTTQLSSP